MLDNRLKKFVVVGGIGFLVDAAILTLLVSGLNWSHLESRFISFATAVSITWYINRTRVFVATTNAKAEYARYVSIQLVGAAINLGVYFFVIAQIPGWGRWPVLPLACGSACAMFFTFVASKHFVFVERAQTHSGAARKPLEMEK